MKILLADDYDDLRQALREALVIAGHEVVVAKNGRDACALMRGNKWDALVADVLMPERDGLEVIADFRRLCPDAAVVAMSGGSDLFAGQFSCAWIWPTNWGRTPF